MRVLRSGLLLVVVLGCQPPPVPEPVADTAGAAPSAPTPEPVGTAQAEPPTQLAAPVLSPTTKPNPMSPSPTMPSPAQPTPVPLAWDPAAAPIDKLAGVLALFCSQTWSDDAWRTALAPTAVHADQALLLPGQPYYIENEAVLSLYTTDLDLQVIWWPRPKGGAVTEIHIVPQRPSVVYEDFVRRFELADGKLLPQSHALADRRFEHAWPRCCGGRQAKLDANQIVWQGEVVGKLGELTLLLETPCPSVP